MDEFKARFQALRQQDPRQTVARFIQIFGLNQLVPAGTLAMILQDQRRPRNAKLAEILEQALQLYESDTTDYRMVDDGELMRLWTNFQCHHGLITMSELALAMETSVQAINAVFKSGHHLTPLKANLIDALRLDLLVFGPPHVDDLFASLRDYDRLKRKLLRAQLGDGAQMRSLNMVSKLTGIRVIKLRHLEMLCHNFNVYAKALTALAKIQMQLGGDL